MVRKKFPNATTHKTNTSAQKVYPVSKDVKSKVNPFSKSVLFSSTSWLVLCLFSFYMIFSSRIFTKLWI